MRLLQKRVHHKKIVILGAGYAGLSALRHLQSLKGVEITLLDRHPYHTIVTELHQAAAHNHDVTLPLEPYLAQVHFFPAEVHSVNLESRSIVTNQGNLNYDFLLIALGSTTNFFRIPGLAEHALELKSVTDAEQIYNRFLALHHPSQPESNVVIGGAGLSGVELATELAAHSKNTTAHKVHIHLLEAGNQILPSLEPTLRQAASEALLQRGVQVHLGKRLIQANHNSVTLEDGTVLPSAFTIWTGGVQASDVVHGQHLERGVGKRLVVDGSLELRHYPNVYVAGDMALALDASAKPVPTTAQHAAQQGAVAAANICAKLRGKVGRIYQPNTLGELVSLGGWLGVGWVR